MNNRRATGKDSKMDLANLITLFKSPTPNKGIPVNANEYIKAIDDRRAKESMPELADVHAARRDYEKALDILDSLEVIERKNGLANSPAHEDKKSAAKGIASKAASKLFQTLQKRDDAGLSNPKPQ